MRLILTFLFLLSLSCFAGEPNPTPINRGRMDSNLNANGHSITNLYQLIDSNGVVLGSGGGSALVAAGSNATVTVSGGTNFVSGVTDTNVARIVANLAGNNTNTVWAVGLTEMPVANGAYVWAPGATTASFTNGGGGVIVKRDDQAGDGFQWILTNTAENTAQYGAIAGQLYGFNGLACNAGDANCSGFVGEIITNNDQGDVSLGIIQYATNSNPFYLFNGVATSSNNAIYVDAINGDDSYGLRGHPDRPIKTLTRLVQIATNTDVAFLAPGNYGNAPTTPSSLAGGVSLIGPGSGLATIGTISVTGACTLANLTIRQLITVSNGITGINLVISNSAGTPSLGCWPGVLQTQSFFYCKIIGGGAAYPGALNPHGDAGSVMNFHNCTILSDKNLISSAAASSAAVTPECSILNVTNYSNFYNCSIAASGFSGRNICFDWVDAKPKVNLYNTSISASGGTSNLVTFAESFGADNTNLTFYGYQGVRPLSSSFVGQTPAYVEFPAAFVGDASGLTNANATTLFGSGTVPPSYLGSGSSAHTILHGNSVFSAVDLASADITGTLGASHVADLSGTYIARNGGFGTNILLDGTTLIGKTGNEQILDSSGTLVLQNTSGFVKITTSLTEINDIQDDGLTASRVVLSDSNKKLVSAAASGAVSINADGTATTFAQINALAPGNILTNGESLSTTVSNQFRVDVTHAFVASNATANAFATFDAANQLTNLNSINAGTALQLSGNVLKPITTEVLTNGATQNIALGGGLTNNSAAGFNGNGAGVTNMWVKEDKQAVLYLVATLGTHFMLPEGVTTTATGITNIATSITANTPCYYSNITLLVLTNGTGIASAWANTNITVNLQTNVYVNGNQVGLVDSNFKLTWQGATQSFRTNDSTVSIPFITPAGGSDNVGTWRYTLSQNTPTITLVVKYEKWHQTP